MTTTTSPDATRAHLSAFGKQFAYDTGYLQELLSAAPTAYERFAAAQSMAQNHGVLSKEAHAIACTTVMLADDCGACAQLNLRMAAAVGVSRDVLQTLLEQPSALPPVLHDIHDHARAVTAGAASTPELVARLQTELGEPGFAELAVVITGARIYPTLKRAFGQSTHCRKPSLDF